MNNIEQAKRKIRKVIAGSKVPEDPAHAENTLGWLLKLDPHAAPALQIASLAHDIDRAVDSRKVQRADFEHYDDFKTAHAKNGALILREILKACGVSSEISDEACQLVTHHEFGGDPASDLLKDADSISYFDVNLPQYYRREGWQETLRRSVWGYQRLSERAKKIVQGIQHDNETLNKLLKAAIQQADL